MTTIWTEFDFKVVIRRKGHRKNETVIVREQAPFEISSVKAAEAPVALRFTGVGERAPEASVIRFHDGHLFAPLVDSDYHLVKAAGTPAADARTELSETALSASFLDPTSTARHSGTLPLGANMISTNRPSDYARCQGAAGARLLDVDGGLLMLVPEPSLVVLIDSSRGAGQSRLVKIHYEAFPGATESRAAADNLTDYTVVAQVPLHRKDLAKAIAHRVGSELSLKVEDTPWFGFPGQRSGATEVIDASYLRCDPYAATLDRTIAFLLKASHETLISANDAFVLAWADMRESRESLLALHGDAPDLAHRSMQDFLTHAPTESEFRVAKAYERWRLRTLPVLRAVLTALPMLKECVRTSDPVPLASTLSH